MIEQADAAGHPFPPEGPAVLVIEDEPGIREIVAIVVEALGYRCRTAGTLAQARRALQEQPFGIVLLDLYLPDGSGLDLLNDPPLRSTETVVAFLSGEQSAELTEQAIRGGAWDFILKPFTLNGLRGRILAAADEWRSRGRQPSVRDGRKAEP